MRWVLAVLGVLLAGCAGVDDVPINAKDGTEKAGVVHGIRHYAPKPYLLVTELPVASGSSTTSDTSDDAKAHAEAAKPTGDQGSGQKTPANQPQTAAPAAPATDTSFAATMASYSVKLVYLPDFAQPFALQMKPGWFGNSSMAPTLQDGWLLVSMNGSADSGGAQVVQALASLVGTGLTGGAAKAAGPAPQPAKRPAVATKAPTPDEIKEDPTATGLAVGRGGTPPPTLLGVPPDKLKTFIEAIRKGAATPPPKEKIAPPIWGNGVLGAGLYAFQYADADADGVKQGEFVGLRTVVYFCNGGLRAPRPTTVIDGTRYTLSDTPCPHQYPQTE
jgi:hypothetical protein